MYIRIYTYTYICIYMCVVMVSGRWVFPSLCTLCSSPLRVHADGLPNGRLILVLLCVLHPTDKTTDTEILSMNGSGILLWILRLILAWMKHDSLLLLIQEMIEEPGQRIGRPRQVDFYLYVFYTGPKDTPTRHHTTHTHTASCHTHPHGIIIRAQTHKQTLWFSHFINWQL